MELSKRILIVTAVCAIAIATLIIRCENGMEETSMAQESAGFGTQMDIERANRFWNSIQGYHDWKLTSGFYDSESMHGDVVRMYADLIVMDGAYYYVILKENYRGEGITSHSVAENPREYYDSVTLMVQVEDGYDTDNENWFWAKYNQDGSLSMTGQNVAMAGKVSPCIDCHTKAAGGDLYFSND